MARYIGGMRAASIRQKFLDYFRARGHTVVPSSSLVPADDPSLLFTNAGMNQFKRVFLGVEQRDYVRATTCQKVVRAGGKHNDLEQVGHTTRHHTFFEMLGNFSFGDYFKREAIAFAWEFVTSPDFLGIHPSRLRVTVHRTDKDARALWREISRLPDHRIYGLGDADNFWQMGDTGPCGPCTELYVDLDRIGAGAGSRTAGEIVPQEEFEIRAESGRYLEIWNLVFMQFDRSADGTLTPLPKPSVDTGAGLERIASVLEGVDSNFHTDLFLPLLDRVAELVGRPYDRGPAGASYRVLADHSRAVSFLLADGVYPSNEGRGYVLRRILRRAVRHAWLLGRREPTLTPLTTVVVREMGPAYPELVTKASFIAEVTRQEEERFLETIEGGLRRLEEIVASGARQITGEEAFRLYDTFGFPIDLTQIIGEEKGLMVDVAGFEQALEAQREQSREARLRGMEAVEGPGAIAVALDVRGEGRSALEVKGDGKSQFVGYQTTRAETEVLASRLENGRAWLLLRDNPFYAEAGGQVSDTGTISGDGWSMRVERVVKTPSGSQLSGPITLGHGPAGRGEQVVAEVDTVRRRDIERNHSATHLVHWALRSHLGPHVRQQGSLVAPERLRFDFSHHGPIDPAMLQSIERDVYGQVLENWAVETREMPLKEALAQGAMAFFQDKYGDQVRVVKMGPSLELCGGTHVRTTGQVGLFRFAGQAGVAAGVRRIEAITGPEAYSSVLRDEERLHRIAETMRAQPDHLLRKLEHLVEEKEHLEERLEELRRKETAGEPIPGETREIGGLAVTFSFTDVEDRDEAARLADRFREGKQRAVLVLLSPAGRGAIHVALTDDLVRAGRKAGDLVNRLAAVSGGKGGGRPGFASAGAGDPTRLEAVRGEAARIISGWLGQG
jgi:alanyl-tRNA synthetase